MATWRSNLVRTNDLRRHPRHSADGSVRILWEDSQGRERVSYAQVANVSTFGVRLVLTEKIPLRSYVLCNDLQLGIQGRGSVRYCNLVKGKYEVGVEFSGGISPRDRPTA